MKITFPFDGKEYEIDAVSFPVVDTVALPRALDVIVQQGDMT